MNKPFKILMLVNWDVHLMKNHNGEKQSPNVIFPDEKYWFFKHWPDENIKVDVIDFCKLPIINHIERWWLKFYVIQTLKALPKIKNYDLIISHGAQSGVVLAFLRSLLGSKLPPHIIIDVGCFNGGRSKKLELLPLNYAVKSLAGVISHNSFQKDYYQENIPYLSDKNLFVPFGADSEFFKPLDLGTEDYIISVGYIKRDWDTLLKAFENLNSDVKLKLVGAGDKSRLKISPKIQGRVECLPYIPIQELKEEIARAKFMVIPLPYYKYSFGQMTLLQGMAMRKAIIVSKVPGVEDYVRDGKNAVFYKPQDWQDLKDKMEMLLKDEKLTDKIARNARLSIESKFNEKNLAENLHRAVGQLCKIEN